MEFIRNEKSKADYDPNTSHCLYGLDADLVLLGLALHEPYFSIIREKVLFKTKRQQEQETLLGAREISFQQTEEYQYLSLNILREYFQLEFGVTHSLQASERLIGILFFFF